MNHLFIAIFIDLFSYRIIIIFSVCFGFSFSRNFYSEYSSVIIEDDFEKLSDKIQLAFKHKYLPTLRCMRYNTWRFAGSRISAVKGGSKSDRSRGINTRRLRDNEDNNTVLLMKIIIKLIERRLLAEMLRNLCNEDNSERGDGVKWNAGITTVNLMWCIS